MAVDPLCSQLEQEIEDCTSRLQSLTSGKISCFDVDARVSSLKQRLIELCTALGWLLQQGAREDAELMDPRVSLHPNLTRHDPLRAIKFTRVNGQPRH
jgi:hypothetical protein